MVPLIANSGDGNVWLSATNLLIQAGMVWSSSIEFMIGLGAKQPFLRLDNGGDWMKNLSEDSRKKGYIPLPL